MGKNPEKILGISRDKLEQFIGIPIPQGLTTGIPIREIINGAEFRVRDDVEDDPSFQQIIPYTVFMVPRQEENHLIFTYSRGKSGDESRLHAKLSIGVGGHIEESDKINDGPGFSAASYTSAWAREISEEISCDYKIDAEMCHARGIIKDDTTLVGSVHIGILHVIRFPFPSIRSRDDSLENSGFISLKIFPTIRDRLEPWSSQVIESGFLTSDF